LTLERDLTGVVRFLICVKWDQSFDNFSTIAEDDDSLQRLSTRMGAIEGDICTIKSNLDLMVQEIKKLSFKING